MYYNIIKTIYSCCSASYHFTILLGELESVWQDFDVGSPLKLVSAISRDVELYVVSFQKSHLGLCVLLAKWQFLVIETHPYTDTTRQRVILWKQSLHIC